MSGDVPNLRPSVGDSVKFWLPLVMTCLWSLGTVVWFASKYPDRNEFNEAVKELHQLQLQQVKTADDAASARATGERLETGLQRLSDQITQQVRRR